MCLQKTSCSYPFKFQRRVSLESSWVWPCLFEMIPVTVICPALLVGSGWGSHRHAQLVDILAQRREVRQFSCCTTAGSLKLCDRTLGATSFASNSKCFSMLLFDFFMTDCLRRGGKKRKNNLWTLAKRIQHCPQHILSVFSVSFPDAEVSLVCALRCFCSRSLAFVTSFPLPVQPMLIITPVFKTLLFPGGVFKNFQIHIPIRQSDSADGFSNNSYSRKERKKRQNICWQHSPHSIFSWLLRQPDHSSIRTVTEVSGTVSVDVRHQSCWD